MKQFYQMLKVSTPVKLVLCIAAVAFEHCLCCSRPTDAQQHKGHVLCSENRNQRQRVRLVGENIQFSQHHLRGASPHMDKPINEYQDHSIVFGFLF